MITNNGPTLEEYITIIIDRREFSPVFFDGGKLRRLPFGKFSFFYKIVFIGRHRGLSAVISTTPLFPSLQRGG